LNDAHELIFIKNRGGQNLLGLETGLFVPAGVKGQFGIDGLELKKKGEWLRCNKEVTEEEKII